MPDFVLRLHGAVMMLGSAISSMRTGIDIARLGALSGPFSASLGSLAFAEAITAATFLGVAALAWCAASRLARRHA